MSQQRWRQQMPKECDLSLTDLQNVGVQFGAEKMTNQENRIRVAFADGSGRVIIVWSKVGGWQDSAKMVKDDGLVEGSELVIVQRGWCALATPDKGGIKIRVYEEGKMFFINPNDVHNTFIGPESRVVAIISGDWTGVTRQASPEFDALTKHRPLSL